MSQQKETVTFNEEDDLSIEELAILEKMMKGHFNGEFTGSGIPRREKHSPVPLSFGQQRLWIIERLVPGKAFYNIPTAFRISGNLRIHVLEQSVNEVIRRHESLRTIFAAENEEPVQVILPEKNVTIPASELRDLSGRDQEEEISRLAFEEAGKPFDLTTGPLLRLSLLHLGQDEHVLLLTTHHIISDTWSMAIFMKEVGTLYGAFLAGKPSPLPEPSIQYPDFALWQREWMQGDVLEKQLSYWRKQLGDHLPILELPADRQRPAVQTYSGDFQTGLVDESLSKKLTELANYEDCSLFMLLLAALNVLLYRYSGQDDILVGTPIANRNRVELEELIGYCSNTLVFRTGLSGNPGFRELLARVRDVTSGAYDNQDIPFEKLVEEFQPGRYMSHTPLFQVMMLIPNVPKQIVDSSGLTISHLAAHNKTCKFDLWLSVSPEENSRMIVSCEYNTDIFDSPTITRFINHFKVLLEGITADPEQPIDDLPILPPEEKKQLLENWNNTAKEYPIRCLHHWFENQAARTPDAAALIFENHELTYTGLNQQANHQSHLLGQKGVQPDTNSIIGIMMERSLEMVIGLLGILKAGGAYLPIDPEYPQDRIDYMLKDSGAKILLTNLSEGHHIDSSSYFASQPSNLAYVIYTSGSTGKPKGVMIPHEGISNRLHWMQETYQLTPDDRILQKTPFSFDVSVWEFFWPLLNGSGLVMAKPGGHKDSAYLVETIIKEKITTIHFVPGMLNVFLEDPGIYRIRSLKRVICSGEALPLEYRDRFFACFAKNVELHNLYGPTEASVDVTAWRCERDSDRRTIPIGRPIANTGIYILDRNLNPVPIGIPGEIHISGIQLAHGYLNQPELTAEKFRRAVISHSSLVIGSLKSSKITNDQCPMTNDRLYRTGDLGRWLADGSIEFLGRLDFQVKVRGFRIELGEIESHLRQHEAVGDAVVLAGEASPGSEEKKLVGYVVPDHDYWEMQQMKSGGGGIDLAKEQVNDWEGVFNDTYARDSGEPDPAFNIIGWNSSYTNGPIPAEEMRLWVDHTVERILSLKPKQVMEIGCGTGLFLFPIIPYCDRYLGTDIAEEGLSYIRQQLERLKEEEPGAVRAEVELMQRSADNFDGIAPDRLDMVILNSVVQYFPSADYLVEVLAGAAERVKPGGHIFIGDVRCLPLLRAFHASVEFYKAAPGAVREQVLCQVMNRLSLEQELVIDPDFFIALKSHLPKIKHVELLVKHGRYANELSKFRYDVILYIDDNDYPEVRPDLVLDWKQETLNIREIRQQLMDMEKEPGTVVITGVPNGRIAQDANILKWLPGKEGPGTAGEFKEVMAKGTETAVDPEDFRELSEDMPYDIVITLSNTDSTCYSYDVICRHHHVLPGKTGNGIYLARDKKIASRPWHEFTNNPLLVKISSQSVPELRRFLKDKLPEYMVPSYFVLMDRLPLTGSGKLDRRALPEPVRVTAEQESKRERVKPRTDEEKLFVDIWKEVLLLDEVGITNNFFELGGDSINAIRMISRANQAGFQLSIQDLYKYQNIEELAMAAEKEKMKIPAVFEAEGEEAVEEFLMELDREEIAQSLPKGVEIEDIYPATPLQCHMVNYLRNHQVNEPPVFIFQRIESPLRMNVDIPTVEKTVQRLIDIYPIFRTLLYWKNLKEPVQVICKNTKTAVIYHDLSHLSPDRQNRQIEELMKEEWSRGIDRDQPIPFRISLIKLADDLYRYFLTCDYPRMEGWGARFFYQDLGACYAALLAGREFTPQTDNYYKSYLFNLKKQDREKARKYWLSIFKGFTGPKSLVREFPGNNPDQEKESGFARQFLIISAETTARLDRILRKERVPFSTLVQAVWGMILSRYANENDIVYGFLTTGRSAASAGIESMVGHAINILPLRLKINPGQLLLDWLKQLFDRHMEWLRCEYTQIEHIYEWLGLSMEQPLFESFVVLQNLAREMGKEDPGPERRERLDSFFAKMEYPIRLDIYPGTEIEFMCNYYRRFVADKVIKGMLENFKILIEAAAENPVQTPGELMNLIQPLYRSFQEDLTGKTVRRIQ